MIEGVDKVIAELLKFGEDVEQFVKDETEAIGRDIETNAKMNASSIPNAPTDLMQKISMNTADNGFSAEISQNLLPMGAYIEFGTGIHVVVAPEWKDMAWQFYVNGKGRLHAAPYMYPAYVKGRKMYLDTLTKKLEILTNKFNAKS